MIGDDSATHDIPYTGRELGQAVDKDIHGILAVLMEARLGVVQHRERAVLVGERGDRPHIGDLPGGRGRRFEEHQPGRSGREHGGESSMVRQRQQRVRHAEPRQQTTK